ncbi:elongation factor G [Ferrovibrio terrae]|uniref:Elongation factor G n=1 Tax=Ferrovibrio terrae TaxID=2594003 RepID=A0A516H0X2_9PROT|nr:elongation factor G [Ferrovibrio terrae]QDO97417.1 elongation factor G [Ferrovibrio terrae]
MPNTAQSSPKESSPSVLSSPRVAAIVGPYTAGKTSLMEALLFVAGAIARKGAVAAGTSVGDASAEARSRQMTIEPNVTHCRFLDEPWVFLDCPGSVELAQEAMSALMVADIAIVVAEPDPARAVTLAPLLRFLDERRIPHVMFVNKLDKTSIRMRDLLSALQQVSSKPLVLREVPIRENDAITGYVDLVSERAYLWRENKVSDLVEMPDSVRPRETEARQQLLETIADFDDTLLEQLLEDRVPAPKDIYSRLRKDLAEDLIVPVFFGSAEHGNGVLRLWKALRHEAPHHEETMTRLDVDADDSKGDGLSATVFKTLHMSHTGKLSLARLWRGSISENAQLGGRRLSGLYRMMGGQSEKMAQARAGDIVGLGRLEEISTGQHLGSDGSGRAIADWPRPAQPVHAMALHPTDRKDDVKLTAALHKLCEEDPSLVMEQGGGELRLKGQGEIHLKLSLDKLQHRFNVGVHSSAPQTEYRETIRHGAYQHARFKRQSGGHGQFADIKVDIAPQARGAGYHFVNRVVGGAIPKNFIPAVDEGVRDSLVKGPLGFPVVDVMVTLTDGQYHSVDSSDQAFRTCGGLAMTEGLSKCAPVLLEPIQAVTFTVPTEYTAKVHAIVSSRRGQILGISARADWPGWDEIECYLPEAEMHDLAVELRSMTLGVGGFSSRFDHLQELAGKLADRVVEDRRRMLTAA